MVSDKRTAAANIINKFFMTHLYSHSTKKIAIKFCQCVSFEETSKMSFEMLSSMLIDDDVLKHSNDMLLRVLRNANWHARDKIFISGTVNVKIILAAWMIMSFPTRVFRTMGVLEKNLVFTARPMLECFVKTATALAEGLSWEEACESTDENLKTKLVAYLVAFKVKNQPWIVLCRQLLGCQRNLELIYPSTGVEGNGRT
jgi:hypothetical protein